MEKEKILRAIDANLNRAVEGVRVAEDGARAPAVHRFGADLQRDGESAAQYRRELTRLIESRANHPSMRRSSSSSRSVRVM